MVKHAQIDRFVGLAFKGLTKEKQLRMNEKKMTDFPLALQSVYKILGQLFLHTYSITYLEKESVKVTISMHTIPLSYKILEKYTSHTTTRRTLFIHALCHAC